MRGFVLTHAHIISTFMTVLFTQGLPIPDIFSFIIFACSWIVFKTILVSLGSLKYWFSLCPHLPSASPVIHTALLPCPGSVPFRIGNRMSYWKIPCHDVFYCSHLLQSRKICCLEVQVVEKKKKKKEKKSSKVISPSAIFNWCANIMNTIGLM